MWVTHTLLTTFSVSQGFLLRAWQPAVAMPAAKKTRATDHV